MLFCFEPDVKRRPVHLRDEVAVWRRNLVLVQLISEGLIKVVVLVDRRGVVIYCRQVVIDSTVGDRPIKGPLLNVGICRDGNVGPFQPSVVNCNGAHFW